MPDLLTVSQVARELSGDLADTIRPRDISTLFYERVLNDARCPIVGGRRLIPREYLATIAAELQRRKKASPPCAVSRNAGGEQHGS
jgi:hypothetical protein